MSKNSVGCLLLLKVATQRLETTYTNADFLRNQTNPVEVDLVNTRANRTQRGED